MWSTTFGVGGGANKPLRKKNGLITKWIHVPRAWTDTMVRTKQYKGNISCRRWNVSSLYVSVSLKAVARELARYKLNLLGVQETKLEKGGTVGAWNYTFSMEKERKIISWEQDILFNTEQYQQLRE